MEGSQNRSHQCVQPYLCFLTDSRARVRKIPAHDQAKAWKTLTSRIRHRYHFWVVFWVRVAFWIPEIVRHPHTKNSKRHPKLGSYPCTNTMLPRSNIHHVGEGRDSELAGYFTQRSLHHKNLAYLGNAKAQAEQLPSRLRRDSVQARLSNGPEALKCATSTHKNLKTIFFVVETVLVCESTPQQKWTSTSSAYGCRKQTFVLRIPTLCCTAAMTCQLWRPLQHLAKVSTILGPRSGLMDGTENLNGNLPSLPEILEGNRKKSQAYENCCKPVWKMRNPQWNRDNPKELWKPTKNRQENNKPAKPKHTTQNWQAKLRKARNGNLHKSGNLTLKKPSLQKMERIRALETHSRHRNRNKIRT